MDNLRKYACNGHWHEPDGGEAGMIRYCLSPDGAMKVFGRSDFEKHAGSIEENACFQKEWLEHYQKQQSVNN